MIALAVAAAPRDARAFDFEVNADSALQGYEVTSPWGDVVLSRRRFLQTLYLGAYHLQGAYDPSKPDYNMVVRLRLDADFGINDHLPIEQAGGETNYVTASGRGLRYIPGLLPAPVDLMFGYIEARNLAGGLFGVRLGRQYLTDVLGWWSFDGGQVQLTTPWYFTLEAYGGLEQRGGLPLSTPRFERQGVWRGSHGAFGTELNQPSVVDYPSYLYTSPAPAFGAAIESVGTRFLHARVSYRRVYNTGTVLTQQTPDPTGGFRTITGVRLSQERVGASFHLTKADLGSLRAGGSYDLYSGLVATAYAGAELSLGGGRATVGADVDYFVPTFDADSIWNFFTRGPVLTATARTSVRITKRFNVVASGGVRVWTTEGDPSRFGADQCERYGFERGCVGSVTLASAPVPDEAREPSRLIDGMGDLSASLRLPAQLAMSLRGMVQVGARGSREGAELTVEKGLAGKRFTLGGRTSVYGWHDPTRPDRDAVSFGYVLAAGYRPFSIASFRVEWEHEVNRIIGQRFRVVGLVNVAVIR